MIGERRLGIFRIDKEIARHFIHRAQHIGIHDAVAAQAEQELHALDALIGARWI